MPSRSKAQLRLMQMALAYKKGRKKRASSEVKRVAKTMSIKKLEDFINTPNTDDLPTHIDEDFATLDATPGMGSVVAPTATSVGSGDTFTSYGLYTQNFLKKTKQSRKSAKNSKLKGFKPKMGKIAFQPFGTISYFHDFIKNLSNRDNDEFGDHNDDSEGSILGGAGSASASGCFDGGDNDSGGDGGGE